MGSFVVVYYGNTGSSWLVQTLASAPGVAILGFEPLEEWAWKADSDVKLAWLHNALSPPHERDGPVFDVWMEGLAASPQIGKLTLGDFSMVGLKMTGGAIQDLEALLSLLKERATKLVFLQRSNRIKHALSLYRYHEEKRSQFEWAGERPPSKLKFRRFDYWVKDSTRLHRDLGAFQARARAELDPSAIITVQYEDFVTPQGKGDVIERLAVFLEIASPSLDASRFEKATPDDLRAAVINYDQLRHRYRNTPLAIHFED